MMPPVPSFFRVQAIRVCAGGLSLSLLGACARADSSPPLPAASAAPPTAFYATPFERRPDAAMLTELGRALFFERALSASGRMSCASCHDPAHAFGPANGQPVQRGGADGRQPGVRAVPSLRYQQDTPPFSEHFNDTDGDDSVDQGPTGGRGWDGRASSAHEQASVPLLSAFEMANGSASEVVARLRDSASAPRFRAAFGERVFDDPSRAWNGVLMALEVFQQSPADFYPYTSRYDDFLRGKADLNAAEKRGLAAFNDPARGNCAQCHPSALKRGAFPQFTDRGFIALGVPRNRHIPANADPRHVDLGLCGPLRTDLAQRAEYCGLFKTPTLRNVALRRVFFHNGVFHRLDEAVAFYAQRDVNPKRFYPRGADGRVRKFDDLPAAYQGNAHREPPFDRQPGELPRLSRSEQADIVAFLRTLTDRP